MDRRKRLEDYYTDETPVGAYIFEALRHIIPEAGYEWLTEENAADLDEMYLYERSGWKKPSPLLDHRLGDAEEMTATIATAMAKKVLLKFGEKWKRLYQVILSEYNPLHNYDKKETHSGADININTPNTEKNETISTSTDVTVTSTPGVTDTNETKQKTDLTTQTDDTAHTHGFNSSEPVDTDSSENTAHTTGDADDNVTTTVTSHEGNDETHTVGDAEDNVTTSKTTRTGTDTMTYTHGEVIETVGNIGVTTSTQMLNEHVEFWNNWNFIENIMADVDTVMVLGIM